MALAIGCHRPHLVARQPFCGGVRGSSIAGQPADAATVRSPATSAPGRPRASPARPRLPWPLSRARSRGGHPRRGPPPTRSPATSGLLNPGPWTTPRLPSLPALASPDGRPRSPAATRRGHGCPPISRRRYLRQGSGHWRPPIRQPLGTTPGNGRRSSARPLGRRGHTGPRRHTRCDPGCRSERR